MQTVHERKSKRKKIKENMIMLYTDMKEIKEKRRKTNVKQNKIKRYENMTLLTRKKNRKREK